MNAIEPSPIQPQSAPGLLATAARETLAHSAAVLVTAAVIGLPIVVLQLIGAYLAAELGVAEIQKQMQSGQINPQQFDFRPLLVMGAVQVLTAVVSVVAMYFAVASVARLIGARVVGRQIGPMEAWDGALRSLGKLLGGSLVMLLIIGAAVIALALPVGAVAAVISGSLGQQGSQASQLPVQIAAGVLMGIPLLILGVYLCPMPSVSAIEPTGAFAALGRSFALVSGSFWRALGALLLGSLCFVAPSIALNWALSGPGLPAFEARLGDTGGAVVAAAPGALLGLVLLPFICALQALIYFTLRARKSGPEGLSVAQLASDLDLLESAGK